MEHGRRILSTGKAEYADVFTQSSEVLKSTGKALNSKEALKPNGWFLMPEAEREVFDRLEAIGETKDEAIAATLPDHQKRRLKNYTATESGGFAGIQTSLDSLMVLKQLGEDKERGLLYVQPRGGGEPFWLEQEPLRPFLFGKDVERWHVGWEGWWVIFPYFHDQGRYRFMPSSDYWDFELTRGGGGYRVFQGYPEDSPRINEDYPKLWAYLEANEAAFRGREGGRFKRKKREEWRWYDLARPQSLEAAEQKKIVAQLLARSVQFAADDGGGMHFQAGGKGGGVYGILLHPSWNEHFFLALLNSKVLDFHLRHVSSVYSSGFYSYADAFLKGLPIPPAPAEQQDHIASLAQRLTEKTAALREREAAVAAFPDSVTEARRAEGDVPDLETLARLGLFQNLPRELRAGRLSSEHDLTGQVIFTIGKGRMTLTADLARFVQRALEVRGKLSREELTGLRVPERDAEQRAYLGRLAAWQEELAGLRREIAGLEVDLNEAVYEVYGLNGEDRKVIEGFLERF